MNDYSKPVKEILDRHGWMFHRHGKGSHDMWVSSDKSKMVSVPQSIKSRHTANSILSKAGLHERFR